MHDDELHRKIRLIVLRRIGKEVMPQVVSFREVTAINSGSNPRTPATHAELVSLRFIQDLIDKASKANAKRPAPSPDEMALDFCCRDETSSGKNRTTQFIFARL